MDKVNHHLPNTESLLAIEKPETRSQPWKNFFQVKGTPCDQLLPSIDPNIRLSKEKDDKKLGG